MTTRAKKLLASMFASALLVVGAAGPAAAHPPALVNVEIENVLNNNTVNVQIPINAAAKICGVDVTVLTTDLDDDGVATCEAESGNQRLTITNPS